MPERSKTSGCGRRPGVAGRRHLVRLRRGRRAAGGGALGPPGRGGGQDRPPGRGARATPDRLRSGEASGLGTPATPSRRALGREPAAGREALCSRSPSRPVPSSARATRRGPSVWARPARLVVARRGPRLDLSLWDLGRYHSCPWEGEAEAVEGVGRPCRGPRPGPRRP